MTTTIFEPVGEHDWRLVAGAEGLLGELNAAGVLESSDVHVALRLGDLAGEDDERVLAAVALAVRAVRHGSVCVDLATVPATRARPALAGRRESGRPPSPAHRCSRPARSGSSTTCSTSTATTGSSARSATTCSTGRPSRPPRWTRWRSTRPSSGSTSATSAPSSWAPRSRPCASGRPSSPAAPAPARPPPSPGCSRCSPTRPRTEASGCRSRSAPPPARPPRASRRRSRPSCATSRPRTSDRVGRVEAMTLHRLLGWRPDNATRFRHDRGNRLKYDLVVVDESSMVELTMMARLLEAVRPQARLVLVGDPRQLTSVGAGAVLSDLVAGYDGDPASPVVSLTENFRSTEDIKTLAEALRIGDADAVLDALRASTTEVQFLETDEPETALRADDGRVRARRPPGGRGRRRRGGGRGAGRAPPALCAPRGTPRRTPLEPAGRALARRGDRPGDLGRVVRRPAAAGDHQRLRAADLQRRDRRRGARRRRPAARLDLRLGRAARLRHRTARRGRHDARDDHPQEPGQPGEADHRAAARGRVPAADPRAVLHRRHPRAGAGARGRLRGGRPRGRRHPRPARDRPAPATRSLARTS